MKRRLVNFRPFVMIAASLIAGILIGYAWIYGAFWAFWTIFCCMLATGIVFFVLKKKKVAICLMIAVLSFLGGFFDFNMFYGSYTAKKFENEEVFISGKLTDYYSESKDSIFISVKEASVNYNETKYNIGVWIEADEDFSVEYVRKRLGCYVDFTCRLNNAPVFKDGINTFYVKNNIAYVATSVKDLNFYLGNLSFDETAREYVRTTLKENMTEDTASIGIALLLGDKSNMSAELKNGYRQMGISHIFAVSGLHMGFIYSILGFVVFKTRIKKWKAVPIVFFPMLFYAWICGFSPSVVRALVMTTCALIFNALGEKNDSLTFLAVAAIIILLWRPVYLFDAGFLLSFSAVIGIICVSRILNRSIRTDNKLLKSLYSVVFISLGATLGSLGLIVEFYGEIAFLSIFFNLLITPFISIIFVLLLVGLLPFLKFVLILPQWFFTMTNFVAYKFSESGFGVVSAKSFGIALLFFYAAMFVFGGFINLKKKEKKITIVSLLTVFAITAVISILPKHTERQINVLSSNSDCCNVVTDTKNNAYIIYDFSSEYDSDDIIDRCKKNNIKNIYAFVLEPDNFDSDNLLALKKAGLKVDSVYFNGGIVDNIVYSKLNGNGIEVFCFVNGNYVEFDEYTFMCIEEGGKAWFLSGEKVTMLFCGDIGTSAFDRIFYNLPEKVDLVFATENEEYIINRTNCLAVVTQNYSSDKIFGTKDLGDFTIAIKNDKIIAIP